MAGIFSTIGLRENAFNPYLNTGTMFDLVTGSFVPGMSGEMILNGGLAYTNGVAGRPQLFKSTTALSLVINAMQYYPGSEHLIYDTESSLIKQRIIQAAKPEHRVDLDSRIMLTDHTQYKAEAFFELIKETAAEKEKHRKDLTVETPFIDPKTGKPQLMMIPTFITIDSWSKMASAAVGDIYEKNEIGSSGTNMVYMKDGNVKTMMISQIPTLAVKHNIYFMTSVHIGDKIDMNPYAPSARELQHMKASDKIKNAGADFNFLMSNLLEIRKAQLLQNDKDCLYPDAYSNAVDLNELTAIVVRCKNNASGAQFNPIISQQTGMLSNLTSYNYIKSHDYYGLSGNKQHHAPIFCPDEKLSRTTVRDKLQNNKNYEVCRAIEILTHLHYIRTNWSLRDIPVDFNVDLEKLAEALMKNSTYAMSDILNSRSYWTYNKDEPRPYLSIFDILSLASGAYKPKLVSVKKSK